MCFLSVLDALQIRRTSVTVLQSPAVGGFKRYTLPSMSMTLLSSVVVVVVVVCCCCAVAIVSMPYQVSTLIKLPSRSLRKGFIVKFKRLIRCAMLIRAVEGVGVGCCCVLIEG